LYAGIIMDTIGIYLILLLMQNYGKFLKGLISPL